MSDTTDTFTDAKGQHVIAGAAVPPKVWERFTTLERRIAELEAALREFADLDARVWPNFVQRAEAALEGKEQT